MPNTFHFRELRRQQIQRVLGTLEMQLQQVQELIADPAAFPEDVKVMQNIETIIVGTRDGVLADERAEQAVLDSGDWRVTDRTYRLVAEDFLWQATAPTMLGQVQGDPLLVQTEFIEIPDEGPEPPPPFNPELGDEGEPPPENPALAAEEAEQTLPLLTPELAQGIADLPRTPGAPPSDFLDQVRAAVNGNEAVLTEVVHAAHRRWLALNTDAPSSLYPYDEMGILLPLRLETLFKTTPIGERLFLRVIPDEASICRDNPNVSATEREFLQAFWNDVHAARAQPDAPISQWLDTDTARVAWNILCQRVGNARAAWLVTEFPPTVENDAPVLNVPLGASAGNRVGGLPSVLKVWGIAGGTRLLIGALNPKRAELSLPLPRTIYEAQAGWWANWEKAKAVGLGDEFDLPDGVTHDNMTALFVAGIDDVPPAEHFRAQIDAGEMGILSLGDPTNSVQGAQAALLARDAESWFTVAHHRLMLKFEPNIGLQDIAPNAVAVNAALTGDGNALPLVPVGATRDVNESRRFVRALAPALWGHYFRDIWQLGDAPQQHGEKADRLVLWAMEHLYPEGPLPPIRIDDQPYGLVPTSAFGDWVAKADETAQLETKMIKGLITLRAHWATAAEKRGTTTNADTNKLIELLRNDALTAKYIFRYFLPVELLDDFYASVGVSSASFQEAARVPYRPVEDLLRSEAARYYLATGAPQYLDLPLIAARRMRWFQEVHSPIGHALQMLETGMDAISFFTQEGQVLLNVVPDSLLIRLLFYSTMLTEVWEMQARNPNPTPRLNPLLWNFPGNPQSYLVFWRDKLGSPLLPPTLISPRAEELHDRQLGAAFELASELDSFWRARPDPERRESMVGSMEIPPERLAQLERAFRATLDTAAYRIDPWLTGIAWRRYQEHIDSPRRLPRLGAYGWVDGPFLGKPGPTAAGRLHAPSQAQALTSVILRDKFLSAKREPAHAQVPPGAPPDGRELWDMNLDSEVVRGAVDLAEEVRTGFHLFEVLGRRVEEIIATRQGVEKLRQKYPMHDPHPHAVCNGLDALNALLKGDPDFPLGDKRAALELLQRTLDAYGDLLVADAVHQVVTGHADTAAQVMDAAAGLDRPPTFEAVQTPPSGYLLQTSVLTAIPAVNIAAHEARPGVIAEPSVDAYFAAQFPNLANYRWRAVGKQLAAQPDGTTTETDVQGERSLADLGFSMYEAALLGEDVMANIVSALVGIDRLESLDVPRPYRAARQLLGAFGTQPAVARALAKVNDNSEDAWAALDTQIRNDLSFRFAKLRDACTEAVNALKTAADDSARSAALRRALKWNIIPTSDPQAQRALFLAIFANTLPAAALLSQLAPVAAETLQNRLPKPDDPPATTIADLARALSTLATGDSKLCILARIPKATLLDRTQLDITAPTPHLDETWLTMVAPVRSALARIEALQLQANQLDTHSAFRAWSNSSNDPWQSNIVQQNEQARATGNPTQLSTPRFVAVYGVANTWDAANLAVGLVDEFGESIPMPQRSTYMAFGFNAPASRAPQAILLAVPPQPRQRLDEETLLNILQETRELAHARAVHPRDLGEYLAFVPTMWFDAGGPDRVRLDTSSDFGS